MSHNLEMNALTPMEDLGSADPGFEVYRKALDSAFDNPQIRNLALSGSLGAGKSSIIRSYDRYRNSEKRFLYISLIDFSQMIKNTKAGKNDQPQLEYSLLNQILSYCTSNDLPEGSIAGIPEKLKHLDVSARQFAVIAFFALALAFHEKFGALAVTIGFPEYVRSLAHQILYVLMALILSWCVYHILCRCLPSLRISKLQLKTKVADAEVNLGKERTTLDTHKFELAYILERIGEKHDHTVVFEDLERLDSDTAIDIMSKLRELNALTNNHILAQGGSTPIRFLYAIGDSTMPAPYRTKFYDCIIPVVPVSHPLNSPNKFMEMLAELETKLKFTFREKWKKDLYSSLSDAFVDYRTLLSLQNEFLVYRAYCKTPPFNYAHLLAITAYKILLPECFERALSPQGNGILHYFSSAEDHQKFEDDLKQHDREKAIVAIRKMFDCDLLDKSSMRLIIDESVLIKHWLQTIRETLDRDTFTEEDEEKISDITDIIDTLEDAVRTTKPDPGKEPYLTFRTALIERLGKLTEDDNETHLLLLVDSLFAVSRTDRAWNTPEIANRYEKCLINRYNAKSLFEIFPGTEEKALRYAKSLVNLSYIQKLPECADTVDLLKKLQVKYPDSQKITVKYAMGLFNLAYEQDLDECKVTIGLLNELQAKYPDNQEVAEIYASGLVNLASEQDLDECKVTIELLMKLHEDYPENQEIALDYAKGLVNLSAKQELAECKITIELLMKLHEEYLENQEIALEYAKGLFNLSNAQDLDEREVTVGLLRKLHEDYHDNQEIALEYAEGLFNLSNAQDLDERKVTVGLLKKLREAYPDNQEIALQYAMGLVNLAAKQELAECKVTIDLLKELREDYPDNQEIAQGYAKGLVNLSAKQELAECKVTIDLLKELREDYPDNQEIALQYAKGLYNLAYKQELAERKVTIDLLKNLREAYPDNQKIAEIYDYALKLLA